ncbi:MAG: hypothetical protein QG675_368 [Patescibacteria group bacterium]|jgi:uncharacterized membrane protein YecN with MAPEG domain|nr:hypothetical protein [Patescibacteria group bacterium]
MKNNRTATLVIGFGLILFAFVILISLLTKLDATSQIINYWPAFLVLVGVLTINPSNPNSNGVSMGIIFLGIFGVMHRAGVFQTPQGQALMAVMLGLVGLVVLVMIASKPRKNTAQSPTPTQPVNKSNRF